MKYELLPLRLSPERSEIISALMRETAATPSLFSSGACTESPSCLESKSLLEMCPSCVERMQTVGAVLGRGDTRAWEVWTSDSVVGLIFFTNVTARDALGHYVFFDRELTSKTGVVKAAMEMMYESVPRLTVEIPTSFVALAKHASKKLGFGGGFTYTLRGGKKLKVEGVKKGAALRGGREEDLLILGLTREDFWRTP